MSSEAVGQRAGLNHALALRLRVQSRLELMSLGAVEELGGLPNPWNCSDHQPLVATLAFAEHS